jgi:PST family polysaccharide transporter
MSEQDLGGKTLSALKWGYGGAAARAVLQLGVQMMLARLLGPEAFGQAMAAVMVMGIGWILSEGGFGSALIQRAEVTDEDVGFALGWVLLLSGGAGLLVMATSPWLAQWLGGPQLQPLIAASGLLIPLQAVGNIPASLMRRNFDVRRSQFIHLGSYVITYGGVGLPLAWMGAGAWSLLVAAGLQIVLSLAGNYWVVRHTLRPRLRGAPGLARFGTQVTAANVIGWIAENSDRLMISRYWGSWALGEYTAAINLSRAPAGLLVSAAQSVTLASASRLQDEPERLGKSYLALLGLVTLVTGPLVTLAALHAEAIVHIVYGARWPNTAPLFAALCAALPSYALLTVSGPVLWALDAVRQDIYTQAFVLLAMFLGFFAMQDQPLSMAVWMVPMLFTVRALWVHAELSVRLRLAHHRTIRAVRGAALLSLGVALSSVLSNWMLPPLPALLSATICAAFTAGLALKFWARSLLAPEITSLLMNRAATSPGLARLCQFLRLRAEFAGTPS